MSAREWTTTEVAILIEGKAARRSFKAIAKDLDRSERSVKDKAYTLGIRVLRVWTPEEDALVCRLIRAKCPQREIARRLGVDERSIRRRVRHLGLVNPDARRVALEAVERRVREAPAERLDDADYVARCLAQGGFPVLDIAAFRRAA